MAACFRNRGPSGFDRSRFVFFVRVYKTIGLEQTVTKSLPYDQRDYVDRHPVFPILVTAAPRLYGITRAEAWQDIFSLVGKGLQLTV
jgi:hypothetical protein